MWIYREVANHQIGTDLNKWVYEVGYLWDNNFHCIHQFDTEGEARKLVHYLNGGEY